MIQLITKETSPISACQTTTTYAQWKIEKQTDSMGARHSTAGGAEDASSSTQSGPGLVAEPASRVPAGQPYPRRSNGDGARASEPGPSSRSSDGTPTSGTGRGLAKHRPRHVAGSSEHRRLALDVLAASGAGRNAAASGSLRATASNDSTPDDSPLSRMLLTSSSFPLHIFAFRGKSWFPCKSVFFVFKMIIYTSKLAIYPFQSYLSGKSATGFSICRMLHLESSMACRSLTTASLICFTSSYIGWTSSTCSV